MLLLTPLQSREALKSSSLEGTYATPLELLQYELNPEEPTSDNDKRNAWREVYNHNRALRHGFFRLTELPMSLRLIREMHKELLQDVRGADKMPGEFRDRQVHVGSDRRYVPPPAQNLAQCLGDLERFLHDEKTAINPLVKAYLVHYQFEAIHPFLDGNGRIGRVLLALTTHLWHHHRMPWLYMSAFYDRYKDEYTSKLFRVSANGEWTEWIDFCLRGTISQCKDAIRRCHELNNVKHELHMKVDHLSPRMHRIIDKFFILPVFQVRNVMEWCGVTRPTAQGDIDALVEAGVVQHVSGEKPRTYSVPMMLRAAYGEAGDEAAQDASDDRQALPN